MFRVIFDFELREWFKNLQTVLFSLVFLAFCSLSMAGAAGLFGSGSTSGELANTPVSTYGFARFFLKLLLLFTPAFIGVGISLEVKANLQGLLFSYPFSKKHFLFAKFASSFLILVLLDVFLLGGLALGTVLPGVNPAQVAPFEVSIWLNLFFFHHLPALFLVSALVFTIVLFTWDVYSGFIGVFAFFILRESMNRFTGGADGGFFAKLLDPLAETLLLSETQFLSPAQQVVLTLPVSTDLFINRLFWIIAACLLLFGAYNRFSFATAGQSPFRRNRISQRVTKDNFSTVFRLELPDIQLDFSFWHHLKTAFLLARSDFFFITRSGSFLVIAVLGALFITTILMSINPVTETRSLPTTANALGFPVFFFSFLIQFLTFLYAGMVLKRARATRMDDLIHVTQAPDWVLYSSKVLALLFLQVSVCLLIMVVSISIQLSQGFSDLQVGLYLQALFGIHLLGWAIWIFAAVFVQTWVSNPFTGLFLLILTVLALFFLGTRPGITPVFQFNQNPEATFFLTHSDFNGYGNALHVFYVYKGYWGVFALVLAGITLIFWRRRRTFSFNERLAEIAPRLISRLSAVTGLFLVLFLLLGTWIYKQERSPQHRVPNAGEEVQLLRAFQSTFGSLKALPQPKITRLFFRMDLFPESQAYETRGTFTLVNETGKSIDSILVKAGFDVRTEISFAKKSEPIYFDSVLNFFIFRLEKSLVPGDSLHLNFTLQNRENTLFTAFSPVFSNGTYLKSDIFPQIGYFANEQTNTDQHHHQRFDSDRIYIESVISTSKSQKIVAPGTALKNWTENGRYFLHSRTDTPIKFVFGINSASFDVFEENGNGLSIQIFHHPGHTYVLKSLVDGIKASHAYHTQFFSAYPHKQIQLVAFPRTLGTYATTSAQTIQLSETRFLQDLSASKTGPDLAFYVAAHELSHQWWGNQLIPAAAPGASMLTESIAEYCTAKIYEKTFSKEAVLKFLAIQKNRYESGKASEAGVEPALIHVLPHQSYVSYGKGALAFYELSERIGEEKLNALLKSFLLQYAEKPAPYPTAEGLIDWIKAGCNEADGEWIETVFKTAG